MSEVYIGISSMTEAIDVLLARALPGGEASPACFHTNEAPYTPAYEKTFSNPSYPFCTIDYNKHAATMTFPPPHDHTAFGICSQL